MIEVRQTATFASWHAALRDRRAAAKITARLERVAFGNLGDVQPIGGGLSELRIHHGPGYRIYLSSQGEVLIVILCGGDKRTQAADIARAKALAAGL